MKTLCCLALVSWVAVAAEPVRLFDGMTLSGWTVDVPEADRNPRVPPTFIVRHGMLVSLGKPGGHLITKRSFANYTLTAQYRFPKACGNAGICVHLSKPRHLYGFFPKSIEIELMHRHAGDFWCSGEDLVVPDMERRRPCFGDQKAGCGPSDARRILRTRSDVECESQLGHWNTLVIDCHGSEIKVTLNGELVNHGMHCTATSGKIAIQAEGTEVEFRKLELTQHP